MSSLRISMWECKRISFDDGMEHVTILLYELKGVEEGDLLEIIYGDVCLFEGHVYDIWKTDVKEQVIHATATSVSSSGAENVRVARVKKSIDGILGRLSDWEREEVLSHLETLKRRNGILKEGVI